MARTCIVIGGGLAGLAAADWLTRHRWRVHVLEARDHFGGRVFTYRFPKAPELNCELGGEWIGDDHREMKTLCRRFGLPLDRHRYGFTFGVYSDEPQKWFAPGKWPFKTPQSKLKKLKDDLRRFKGNGEWLESLDRLDWWTVLREYGFSDADLRLRDLMDGTDFGESIRMTSGYAGATEYLAQGITSKADEMDFKIRGGNSLLIDALVKSLALKKQALHTNSNVKRVQYSARGVIAHVQGMRLPLQADYCICAIPAREVSGIDWDDPLPGPQKAALEQLQYARIVKTAVLFNKRFWKAPGNYGFSAFTGGTADFCFDSTLLQRHRRGILCSYSIGDKADDIAAAAPSEVSNWIREDMLRLAPTRKRRNVVVLDQQRMAWQETSIGGAYALYRPGQLGVSKVLSQPLPFGRVHFAGEHIADWQGFMEGAVETGQAAAKSIEQIESKPPS